MELKRDLLIIQTKSVFRIIMGILFFVISITYVVGKITNDQIIGLLDWLVFGIFLLNGVILLTEGFGFKVARLFGKAFVLVDDERIAIKRSVLKKEQSVSWKDIKSISYKPIRFKIEKNDDTSMTFNLSKLDFSLIKEIKNTVMDIAGTKGLNVS